MPDSDKKTYNLIDIADLAMVSRGLEPDFSDLVRKEIDDIKSYAIDKDHLLPDLTQLLWCSMDNDDSMDLDQISVSESLSSGKTKILVAVSDVDAVVRIGSAIDQHAKKNTTSVYTGAKIFPMLPEKLSTNLTSLSEGEVRIALVMEMVVDQNGAITESKIYRARVLNHAKLAYDNVSEWLEGKGHLSTTALKIKGIDNQLRVQDRVAQTLRKLRHKNGALELETIEPRAIFKNGVVVDLKQEKQNRARELIEDFMVSANGITARYLTDAGYPTLRRVVRSPKRWDRIIEIASDTGDKLPSQADSKALEDFLSRRREADPIRFPDLSLVIVKLLGRGEYILEMPGGEPLGHFGLAVRDYSHSTAPNRRFPDLIAHRLLKAAMDKRPSPYSKDELSFLAAHCTTQEDAANKVERQVRKSEGALLLSSRIGQHFDGIVTGASGKGTWARIFEPPVEGKIVHGERGMEVGNKVRVKLIGVNVEKGFIDFVGTMS
ncbi:MAG: RNB domain-containing ribonuclease [Proteobacteria bacterium]|nr:RNB domain-containing ribonuclease [Pseudomonadota bacterium]